jgi:hypothetical protein
LYIHTNGGVHDRYYWEEIATIMNGHGQIDFGIDGLADTLGMYRRNVKYAHVIQNAKAFIKAGGRAQWNYIVFKHNEHQVEEARETSKALGFYNFLPRKSASAPFFGINGFDKNKEGLKWLDRISDKLIET